MKKFLIAIFVLALCATDSLAGCKRPSLLARLRDRQHLFGHPAGTIGGCGASGCSLK